ncbi:ATP-binding protein [Azospirillum brasilense]|uniref:ATP-binding protein n=1 Tax=Azospirillum brasilense TaxID=192 RepID=A0A235HAV9_AZOBR|nr:ATP-binding protein [Azospirillum brasilense]OYD82647.1 ATP-binding protein [Azospirillum brasilense]
MDGFPAPSASHPPGPAGVVRPFSVVRDRVPTDIAARVAARFGLSEAGGGVGDAVDGRAAAAVLLAQADRDILRSAFGLNSFLTVELTEREDGTGAVDADWLGAPPVERGFYLSLTTGTAYGLQCAVLVCDELTRRGVLTPERRGNVELCLHEAIANAIVHGNLGIPSATKEQPEGYRLFSRLLRERLGDGTVRQRRIDIFARWTADSLSIAVVDQGNGFDAAALPQDTDSGAHSGRGFVFMRALARRIHVTDGGRCTLLQFDL